MWNDVSVSDSVRKDVRSDHMWNDVSVSDIVRKDMSEVMICGMMCL
jgi:hypothetical protein